MGIYIPDMEMPKDGQMLVIFPDGTSYVCFNGMRERLAQTKAVPVPPHGRLIDAKKLFARVTDYYGTSYTIDMICDAPTIIPAEEEKS